MFTPMQYRAKADEAAESLKHTENPSDIRKLQQSIQTFGTLADNEDWLKDNYDKMIHSVELPVPQEGPEPSAFPTPDAESEEQILRCLGAAVIMSWSTIPTKLQRELFDTAGSMGDVLSSVELRGQIARFLHKQNATITARQSTTNQISPKGHSMHKFHIGQSCLAPVFAP